MSAIRSAKRARIRSRGAFIAIGLCALTAVGAGSILAYRAYAAARDAALAPQITEMTEARLTSVDNASDSSDGTSSASSTTAPTATDSDSDDDLANTPVASSSTTSTSDSSGTTAPELLADLGSGHSPRGGSPDSAQTTQTTTPGIGFNNGPIANGPAPRGLGTISAPDAILASNSTDGGPQGSSPSSGFPSFPGIPSLGASGGGSSPGPTGGGSPPSPTSTAQNTHGGASPNGGASPSNNGGGSGAPWQIIGTQGAGGIVSPNGGSGGSGIGSWQYTGTQVAVASPGNSSSGGSNVGSTPDNPYTPVSTTANGYQLPISGNNGNSWQYFDPPVAVGFNYELKPSAADQALTFGITGIRVVTKVGSGQYQLWLYDVNSGQYVNVNQQIDASATGDFNVVSFLESLNSQEDTEFGITDPALGLTRFSLRGIDPNADLDPNDPSEFVTGLLFTGTVDGNLWITPLTFDPATGLISDPPPYEVAVPEPSSLTLFGMGLAALMLLGATRRSTG